MSTVGLEDMAGRPKGPLAKTIRFLTRGPAAVVLAIVGFLWLIPSFGLLISSLRPAEANSSSGWWTAFTNASQFTFENYRNLFESAGFVRSIWNTVQITVPVTVLVVLIAAAAGYAFAWVDFPAREVVFLVVVGLIVVPLQIGLIPVAKLYSNVGLFGRIPGAVLYHVAFGLPLAIFLLRNFFIGIPHELLEASRMDGASEAQIFFRVVLPLGIPAIASLAIFQFLWVWNDLLVALVFTGRGAQPITVAIQQQLRQFGSNVDIIAPAAFIQMIVPLAVFFAFQRYFVQGLLAGSQK